MKHRRTILLAAVALTTSGLFGAPGLMAAQVQPAKTGEGSATRAGLELSGRLSLGYLTGEADEYVYDGGHTVSQLIWDIDATYMLGVGASISTARWFRFNADVYFNLGDGDASMEDYDWLVEGLDWTHFSVSEDTDVSKALLVDINAEVTAYDYGKGRLYALVGYKHDHIEWDAYGGSYIYSVNGFRDEAGSLPDGVGISYEQTYDSIYFGVGLRGKENRFTYDLKLAYSPFVDADDADMHHWRNMYSTSDYSNEDMWSFSATVGYDIIEQLNLSLSYLYEKYDTMRGDAVYEYRDEGLVIPYPDAAGVDLEFSLVSLSLQYTF